MSSKIGALIPIRLSSERLPRKAIKYICGKPAIYHLLDRVFTSKYIMKENVVVCTTKESCDDPLVKIVKNYGANIFRGSTNDIINRFYNAIIEFGFDYVIQIDGDDITAEPLYMDLTMEKLLSVESLDIVTCKGLPLGIASKAFSRKSIEKVIKKYKTLDNDTGFIYYFTKTDFCKNSIIEPVSKNHIYDKVRLTLDYKEDLHLFRVIFSELYKEGEIFHIEDILNLIKEKPKLAEINFFLQEEYWQRTADKLNLYYYDINDCLKKVEY